MINKAVSTVLAAAILFVDVAARSEEPTQLYDWPLRQLKVPEARGLGRGSSKVVVAVIDLGYRHHPKLDGHLWVNPKPDRGDLHGWDFADDDATLEYRGPGEDAPYYRNHHVFVAGEVAAVAPECPIMIARISYSNHDSWWKAVRYAADHGARVLIMPHGYIGRAPDGDVPLFYQGTDFAYPADNPKLREALDYAYDRGCLVFSGTADNRGRRVGMAPPAWETVCAVGSTSSDGRASELAASADYVEFAAPAGTRISKNPADEIRGLGGDQNTCTFSGGCMAAGFSGGTAALVWSRFPSLSNNRLRMVLRNTAVPSVDFRPDSEGRDSRLGFGVLNAFAAMSLENSRLTRDVRVKPESFRIESSGSKKRIRLTLTNLGAIDAQRAMVVVYDGDPTRAADPAGTLRRPAAALQTRQLGHAIVKVRGLHETAVMIESDTSKTGRYWFETFCLDRHDEGKVHRCQVSASTE